MMLASYEDDALISEEVGTAGADDMLSEDVALAS